MAKKISCCSGASCDNSLIEIEDSVFDDPINATWSDGYVDHPRARILKIKTTLEAADILGAVKARLGINRNDYSIYPGLYALGIPDANSPVLVTANYKLTFDYLRRELEGQNLWLLVLNTHGINVWCAAGKGTFGTGEIICRIGQVQLANVVSHKKLILPQLGAPGVAGHEVTRATGFKVVYGPVRAADIPAFLRNNHRASGDMRKVKFNLADRLAVVPVELNHSLKLIPLLFVLLLLFNLITPNGWAWNTVWVPTLMNLVPYLIAILLGTAGIAAFLPYLPFRSFALKSLLLALPLVVLVVSFPGVFHFPDHALVLGAHALFLAGITTFFGLNFTGCTTYTSLSGVRKETIYTLPVIALSTLAGLVLAVIYQITRFSI